MLHQSNQIKKYFTTPQYFYCHNKLLFYYTPVSLVADTYQFLVVEGEAQTLQHGDEDNYVFLVGGDGTKHVGQLPQTLLQRIDI